MDLNPDDTERRISRDGGNQRSWHCVADAREHKRPDRVRVRANGP